MGMRVTFSGAGNDGTLEGGTTFASGKVGQAFSFDGVDDYVSLGTSEIIGDATSFTIDAWIWIDGFVDKQLPIYGEYSSLTDDAKNYLAVGNTQSGLEQRVFFDQFIPTGGFLRSTTQLTAGQWHHVAYTQAGTTRILYIDGVPRGTDSVIETYSGALPNDVRIGRRGGTANMGFDGLIDEVEIFNRALTGSEVLAIFEADRAGKCKTVTVQIDIKPGSDPNSINCSSKGVIPLAILTTDDFDATTVDPTTVALDGVKARIVGKKEQTMCHLEDVDGDGDMDMVCQIATIDYLTVCPSEGFGQVTATTVGGTPITGTDSVRFVPDN
jgi:hypothetical protein